MKNKEIFFSFGLRHRTDKLVFRIKGKFLQGGYIRAFLNITKSSKIRFTVSGFKINFNDIIYFIYIFLLITVLFFKNS